MRYCAAFASVQTETTVFYSGYKTLITSAIDAHVMASGSDLVRNIASVYRVTARIARRAFTGGYPDRRLCPYVHRGTRADCFFGSA
jgi:hypothetical protein